MFETPQSLGAIDQVVLDRQERLRQKVANRLANPDSNGSRNLEVPRENSTTDVELIIGELQASRWAASMRFTPRGETWLDIVPEGEQVRTAFSTYAVPTPDELHAMTQHADAAVAAAIHKILATMLGTKTGHAYYVNADSMSQVTMALIREILGSKEWQVTVSEDYRETMLSISRRPATT